jgi:hypothetical protein
MLTVNLNVPETVGTETNLKRARLLSIVNVACQWGLSADTSMRHDHHRNPGFL